MDIDLDEKASVRIDRWLWAARFFKSRTRAAKACDGGKIEINSHKAKPHKMLKVGDFIKFTTGNRKRKVKVIGLSEKRGPAPIARQLYEDMSPPTPSMENTLGLPPLRQKGAGRPTKHERRQLRKLRGR